MDNLSSLTLVQQITYLTGQLTQANQKLEKVERELQLRLGGAAAAGGEPIVASVHNPPSQGRTALTHLDLPDMQSAWGVDDDHVVIPAVERGGQDSLFMGRLWGRDYGWVELRNDLTGMYCKVCENFCKQAWHQFCLSARF